MGRILSFFNKKGGVGKTTLVENLGYGLSMDGYKVLLVDMDPQANLTATYGVDPYSEEVDTVVDVLTCGVPVKEALCKDVRPNIDLLPSGDDLFICDRKLYKDQTFWFSVLKKALKPVRDDYDFILIDSAPYLGSLTVNALIAADEIYAPLLPESHSLKGIRLIRSAFDYLNDDLEEGLDGRPLDITAIVISQIDGRLPTVHKPNEDIIRASGLPVLKACLRVSSAIKKAQQAKLTVYELDPSNRACEDFDAIKKEILNKGGKS